MPVMYSFCFWFSVRLGAIIVAIFSMLQSLPLIIVVGIGLGDLPAVSTCIDKWLDSYELLALTDMLQSVRKDPYDYLVVSMILLAAYTASCVLLILGALKCNLWLVYPYISLDLARLLLLTATFITVMMIVKENILNLGLIIGGCLAGGFSLLYLYYLWFCTISLCQVVKALDKIGGLNKVIDQDADKMPFYSGRKAPLRNAGFDSYMGNTRPLYGMTRTAY